MGQAVCEGNPSDLENFKTREEKLGWGWGGGDGGGGVGYAEKHLGRTK